MLFKHLRVKEEPVKVAPDPGSVSVNDPIGERFRTDYDDEGQPTQFGTVR